MWIAFKTIVIKEILRFSRIWVQTIVPPVITTSLYLLIFGGLMGSRIGQMRGIDYLDFIVPGIILMTVIMQSYANTVSSFFMTKYNNSFDYILEQTCFCAIDPKNRHQYSNVAYDLVKVGGRLIGLWMPLDKDIKEGGPPFGVKEDEVKKLFSKQWKITEDCFPVQSIQARKGREKLIVFEKL